MFRFWIGRLCLFAFVFMFNAQVWADENSGFEGLLKGALKDYLERKADEAGLDTETLEQLASGQADSKDADKPKQPDKVTLQFSGAEVPPPDVFAPLVSESPPANTGGGSGTAAEQACYNAIQGKVAWNDKGNTSWTKSNVQRLCKGTSNASAPGVCFKYAMFNGSSWGKKASHKMNWSKAVTLCAGTSHAGNSTTCFKAKISAGRTLDDAIKMCARARVIKPGTLTTAVKVPTIKIPTTVIATGVIAKNEESSCYKYVQGNIAWDSKGKNKKWSPANVNRLCKGTTSTYSPGNCFKYAMFNGSSWGKKATHVMNWSKAIDLCEGISNANQATTCFKNKIAKGKNVDQAINSCEKKGS